MSEITTWTRVEAHARTTDLSVGLAAEVADPLWLLARQLQFGELKGDDGGSPVAVDVRASWSPITALRCVSDQQVRSFPEGLPGPLEALVEREPELLPGGAWGPRVRAGRDLARRLEDAGLHRLVVALLFHAETVFIPDAPKPGVPESDDDQRYAQLLTRRAIDAIKVLQLIGVDGRTRLPDEILLSPEPPPDEASGLKPRGLTEAEVPAAQAVLAAWAADAHETWGVSLEPRTHAPAWVRERLEYAFHIAAPALPPVSGAPDPNAPELLLSASEYDGTGVDWHTFDLVDVVADPRQKLFPPEPAAGGPPRSTVRTALPTPLTFPGAPADRFWEFEDAAVTLQVSSGPTDLARLIATEFSLVSSPDWLLAPVEVPVGSVATVDWVIVRDTFGVATLVGDRDTQRGDGVGRQFQPSTASTTVGNAEGDHPLLVVLPSALAPLRSAPRERVAVQRDEIANVAWLIEHTIAGRVGRGIDRRWAAEELILDEPDPSLPGPYDVWRLSTPVPSTWFPMVAEIKELGTRLLRRARLLDTPAGVVRIPASQLATETDTLREEEVPRTGIQVTTLDQLVRWHDGRTFAWRGREKTAGRGEASSALRYDDLTPQKKG
jgi:hypothetical protein